MNTFEFVLFYPVQSATDLCPLSLRALFGASIEMAIKLKIDFRVGLPYDF